VPSEDSEELEQWLQVPLAEVTPSLQLQQQIQAARGGVQGGGGARLTRGLRSPPRTEERRGGGHARVAGVIALLPAGLDRPRGWVEGVLLLSAKRFVQQERQHRHVRRRQLSTDDLEDLVKGEQPVVVEALRLVPGKRVIEAGARAFHVREYSWGFSGAVKMCLS